MISLFKKHKEPEASRLNRIARNSDIEKRIQNIADHEFKRFIFLAEKEAINGRTSLIFDLRFENKYKSFANQITYKFSRRLYDEGFIYTRHLLTDPNRFTVHFSNY